MINLPHKPSVIDLGYDERGLDPLRSKKPEHLAACPPTDKELMLFTLAAEIEELEPAGEAKIANEIRSLIRRDLDETSLRKLSVSSVHTLKDFVAEVKGTEVYEFLSRRSFRSRKDAIEVIVWMPGYLIPVRFMPEYVQIIEPFHDFKRMNFYDLPDAAAHLSSELQEWKEKYPGFK